MMIPTHRPNSTRGATRTRTPPSVSSAAAATRPPAQKARGASSTGIRPISQKRGLSVMTLQWARAAQRRIAETKETSAAPVSRVRSVFNQPSKRLRRAHCQALSRSSGAGKTSTRVAIGVPYAGASRSRARIRLRNPEIINDSARYPSVTTVKVSRDRKD